MDTLLICNAQIVNEGCIQQADIFIRGGRIARIGKDLSHLPSDHTLDVLGKYLLPGIIDSQFTVPDLLCNPDVLRQESQAALAGGITSIMLLPSSDKGEPSPDHVSPKVAESAHCNFATYKSIRRDELNGLQELSVEQHCGLYVSTSSEDDQLRFDNATELEQLLVQSPILVAVHAESGPLVAESEESHRQIYGDNIPFHLHSVIHGDQACASAAKEVLELAKETQARVHLLHVSSAAEVELLEHYRDKQQRISADICSHFLTFSDADYSAKGSLLKYDPAIKTDVDRAALIQAVLDGQVDTICSGHIPISEKEKQGAYFDVRSGLPQAQFALPSILEHYQDQILSLETIVQKTSHAVADKFAIQDRGYIREGYWADLVLIDVEGSFIARDEDVISSAGWTIFSGNEFRSSVLVTILNGKIAWAHGEFAKDLGLGQCLQFIRN